jgi:hypothetical protein
MTIGAWFWILMVLWAIFGIGWNSLPSQFGTFGMWGNWLLLFVLFALLGYHDFGSVIH